MKRFLNTYRVFFESGEAIETKAKTRGKFLRYLEGCNCFNENIDPDRAKSKIVRIVKVKGHYQ